MDPLDAIDAIGHWSAERCIVYLEEDGAEAPEYDLETERGLQLLRQDCKRKAFARQAA